MHLGIIGAMQTEIDLIVGTLANPQVRPHPAFTAWQGTIGTTQITIMQSGIGKAAMAAATQYMIDAFAPDALINTGVAGALQEGLQVMDVVIATDLVHHDVDVTALGYTRGHVPGFPPLFEASGKMLAAFAQESSQDAEHIFFGRIASGDLFVADPAYKADLVQTFNAAAAEMEGAALAQVCTMNNVPFCVLRAMSDTADGQSTEDYPVFEEKAAKRMAQLLIDALPALDAAFDEKNAQKSV